MSLRIGSLCTGYGGLDMAVQEVFGGTVHLIAAPAEPADLLLPDHQAAALPKQSLAAWCPDCHHGTRTAAHRAHRAAAPAAEPASLFDL